MKDELGGKKHRKDLKVKDIVLLLKKLIRFLEVQMMIKAYNQLIR